MDQDDLNEQDETQVEESEEVVSEEAGGTPEGQEEQTEDDDSLVVSLEGEQVEESEQEAAGAPQWVKDLRKEHRNVVRELKELKAKEAKQVEQAEQQKAKELGEKPTLAGCDYDEQDYETKLAAWHQRKTELAARERDAQAEQERANAEWNAKREAHQKAAAALRVPDYDEAEEVVREQFTDIQQAIMLEADNSALLAYAIGKRPAKAKELASIKNPVKFAMALAKLETQVKTTPKKSAPAPESRVRASAPVSGVVDSKLAKLMEEADRTGDRTKVAAYYREQRQRAA